MKFKLNEVQINKLDGNTLTEARKALPIADKIKDQIKRLSSDNGKYLPEGVTQEQVNAAIFGAYGYTYENGTLEQISIEGQNHYAKDLNSWIYHIKGDFCQCAIPKEAANGRFTWPVYSITKNGKRRLNVVKDHLTSEDHKLWKNKVSQTEEGKLYWLFIESDSVDSSAAQVTESLLESKYDDDDDDDFAWDMQFTDNTGDTAASSQDSTAQDNLDKQPSVNVETQTSPTATSTQFRKNYAKLLNARCLSTNAEGKYVFAETDETGNLINATFKKVAATPDNLEKILIMLGENYNASVAGNSGKTTAASLKLADAANTITPTVFSHYGEYSTLINSEDFNDKIDTTKINKMTDTHSNRGRKEEPIPSTSGGPTISSSGVDKTFHIKGKTLRGVRRKA